MATYTINYLAGETDTVTADRITSDERPVDYTFSNDDQIVAVIPIANVRSILREDDQPDMGSATLDTTEIPVVTGQFRIGGTHPDAHIETILKRHLPEEATR